MPSLKQEIEAAMTGYERTHRETKFVSKQTLRELLAPEKLRQSLRRDYNEVRSRYPDSNELDGLVADVRDSAMKLYAVLIMIDKPEKIIYLLQGNERITDEIFDSYEDSRGPYCHRKALLESRHLQEIADEVYEMQWLFPPVLDERKDQRFPCTDFRFPFMSKPERYPEQGSWGVVSKVIIAEGHLNTQDAVPGNAVAHKIVKKSDKISWDTLRREVDTLRARRHKNIIPLLTSFTAGREEPVTANDPQECLHMLFPQAKGGDMKAWFEQPKAPFDLFKDEDRHAYVYKTIQDIVSGVTFIHREVDQFISMFHHDIKPGNILLFYENKSHIRKISDFGNARLKDKRTEQGTGTVRTDENKFGTYMYTPPEYFDNSNVPHGRAFDVYSLGCVLLELATIILHGWDPAGLATFKRKRAANVEHQFTGAEKPDPDYSFHNSPQITKSWIEHLRGTGTRTLCELLDLVTLMLETRADQRIFAWEVDMEIYDMLKPHASLQERKKRLKEVVQQSRTPQTQLHNHHNPLQRAITRNKPEWWQAILRKRHWSYSPPAITDQLRQRVSRVNEHYSTLKDWSYLEDFRTPNELIGRHEIHKKIEDAFGSSNCVGLYGLSGIGKSHLAYHFVNRFMTTDKLQERKHTFWVEASNRHNFQKSMRAVAAQVNIDISETGHADVPLKEWLANKNNGPWIMVIDGLDNAELAKEVKMALPEDCGQLLVTTKVRDVLKHFIELRQVDFCLHVDKLKDSDNRKLFISHAWDASIDKGSPELDEVLRFLHLPVFVKFVAKYITEMRTPLSAMSDNLQPGKSERVQERTIRLFEKIFSPLFPSESNERKQTFKLLGELSCFAKEGVEFDVVAKGYKDKGRLWEMIGKLDNCSFIGRDENRSLFMHGFVQRGVRQVMEKKMGLAYLLQLHQHALCMLFLFYIEQRKESAEEHRIRTKGDSRMSYLRKLPLMPHFERFLDFAKANQNKLQEFAHVVFEDRAVKCVNTFAQVYVDEGRYDDAVCVLEFTKKLYKGSKNQYQLGYLLFQAYNSRPGSHEDEQSVKIITSLIEELTPMSEDKSMDERWQLHLESARMARRSSDPEKAFQRLQMCSEMELHINKGRPQIYNKLEGGLAREKLKQLVIDLCMEDARTHLCRAKLLRSKGQHCAVNDLRNAKAKFDDSKVAIEKWFPRADEWLMDVKQDTAGVLEEMGNPKDLLEAEGLIEERYNWMVNRSEDRNSLWSRKKRWDLRCKIARIRLKRAVEKGKKELRREAIEDLRKALTFYEEQYGKNDGHTRKCALWLKGALKEDGQIEEAQNLQKRLGLSGVKKRHWRAQREPTRTGYDTMWLWGSCLFLLMSVIVWNYKCLLSGVP